MYRYYVITFLLVVTAGSQLLAQERGVEFSFLPNVTDTTAGSVLYFEILARDEQGTVLTDWATTGYPVQIELRNSTANTDTSTQSWNQNKLGYSFAKMFDASGRELATLPASPNTFYVPNTLFSSDGRLQIAFTHTKAESDVYLQILPKMVSSEFQSSRMRTYTPGSVNNYLVDITGQTAADNQVYRERAFELVVAARDRFLNIVRGEVPVSFTARFPAELPGVQGGTLPIAVDGFTSVMLAPSKTRISGEVPLQHIKVFHPSLIGIEGTSDVFEVLDHAPMAFKLGSPPSGTEIQLRNWQDEERFDWNAAIDPYTNIHVSRFDGRVANDTIFYRLYIADYNNLVTKVSYRADEDGRATSLNLSHWTLAEAAKTLHGDGTTRLNAVWSVNATDGIYAITSTSAHSPNEEGHTLQADLLTLDVERIGEAASNYTLKQNYPNPFNPSTTIEYTVPERTPVRIQVFDVYGSLVATLVDTQAEPGSYRVVWDGRTDHGSNAPSGSYVLTMTTGKQSQTRVMSLIQ